MKCLIAILLLSFSLPCLASQDFDPQAFWKSLKRPVIKDVNPRSKHPEKGMEGIDEIVVYALKDSGGRRFCVAYYGYYGERWLREHKQGAFVLYPKPIENFYWGGFCPPRHSKDESALAGMVAKAFSERSEKLLKIKKDGE